LKFKTIYIFFNTLLVISFTVIFFMPFFMLGWGYVKVFWLQNWYIAAVFCIVFAALNIYFLYNWKLFSLLEKEDWKGVCRYLEQRIYEKNRVSRQAVRLLINTYIVLADMAGLEKLSRRLEEKKSRVFALFALELGIPYMLGNDSAAPEAYFARAVANPKTRRKDWLRWNLALAWMRDNDAQGREKAAGELTALAGETKNPVLLLLTAYLLDGCGKLRDDSKQLTASIRNTLKQNYARSTREKISRQSRNDLIILILSQLLDEAEKWLFENEE
jgi:hypothetical protein